MEVGLRMMKKLNEMQELVVIQGGPLLEDYKLAMGAWTVHWMRVEVLVAKKVITERVVPDQ